MGFYLKKSLRAGPFRFNLSKSGLGISTGIPGFRVGLIGPRGHYVQMGRKGLYYRKSLNARRTRPGQTATPRYQQEPTGRLPAPWVNTVSEPGVAMEDVTGATIFELAAANASDMVGQMTEAQRKLRILPWCLGCYAIALWLALSVNSILATLVAIVGAIGVFYAHQWDAARRSVVAFYDVQDETAGAYQVVVDAFRAVQQSNRARQIVESGNVTSTYKYKVSAGASKLISTQDLKRNTGGPPVLETNIEIPSLATPRRAFFFLPDRIVVREGSTYADIPYGSCSVDLSYTRFIESGSAPRDAQVIDQTWRYVNVKGGPDRRFNNNAVLPITRMAEIRLTTPAGLNAIWQLSAVDAAYSFAGALHAFASAIARVPSAPAEDLRS